MDKNEIHQRQQALEQKLANYRGDDPLELRYEFISWLDKNCGRENVMDTFLPILEDTLKIYWNVARYQQDARFIQILIAYVKLQGNSIAMYESIYEKGTGNESPMLYISWANAYVENEDYKKADEIFNLGLSKTKSNGEVKKSYSQFLIVLGKKYLLNLDSMINVNPKCSTCSQKSSTAPEFSKHEEVQNWEVNPLRPGEKDDFTCLGVIHDPPDETKKPVYPKHLVYVGDKEYSLEEIRAQMYIKIKKEREEAEKLKLAAQQKNEMKYRETKEQTEEIVNADHNTNEITKQLIEKHSVIVGEPEKTILSHLTPSKSHAGFPTSLAPPESPSITQTSYTVNMKEAMNVVQEMWSSPAPPVASCSRSVYKSSVDTVVKEPPETFSGENIAPSSLSKKTLPFSIFTEDESPKQKAPTSSSGDVRPIPSKAMTSLKKNPLQMREFKSVKENNTAFSERKPKGTNDMVEFNNKPIISTVKQQLPFSNAGTDTMEDNQNGMLAMKLGYVSIAGASSQPNRITNIKPLLPPEEDDFTDVTCNTKAFNFSLPSSTPIHSKKFSGARNVPETQGTSEETPGTSSSKSRKELSMILEASKERCSSSNSGQHTAVPQVMINQKSSSLNFVKPDCDPRFPYPAEFPKAKEPYKNDIVEENTLVVKSKTNNKKKVVDLEKRNARENFKTQGIFESVNTPSSKVDPPSSVSIKRTTQRRKTNRSVGNSCDDGDQKKNIRNTTNISKSVSDANQRLSLNPVCDMENVTGNPNSLNITTTGCIVGKTKCNDTMEQVTRQISCLNICSSEGNRRKLAGTPLVKQHPVHLVPKLSLSDSNRSNKKRSSVQNITTYQNVTNHCALKRRSKSSLDIKLNFESLLIQENLSNASADSRKGANNKTRRSRSTNNRSSAIIKSFDERIQNISNEFMTPVVRTNKEEKKRLVVYQEEIKTAQENRRKYMEEETKHVKRKSKVKVLQVKECMENIVNDENRPVKTCHMINNQLEIQEDCKTNAKNSCDNKLNNVSAKEPSSKPMETTEKVKRKTSRKCNKENDPNYEGIHVADKSTKRRSERLLAKVNFNQNYGYKQGNNNTDM